MHRNRFSDRARSAATNRTASQIQPLERRVLLSVAPPDVDPPVAPVTWHGHQATAVMGEWIARFDGVAGPPAEQLAAVRGRLADASPAVEVAKYLGLDGLVLLRAAADVGFAALEAELAQVPGYRFSEPNFAGVAAPGQADAEPVFPGDPLFGQKWSLHNTGQTVGGETGIPDADIDMPEAWDLITGGIGRSDSLLPDHSRGRGEVVVGVIEGGIDYTHPDLVNSIWQNLHELNGEAGVDDDGNGYVDDVHGYDFIGEGDPDPMPEGSHGTHVAGIIGASANNGLGVPGVNWGVKMMSLKFISGTTGTGAIADAVEAINYATMMRKRGVNIRLTNNSWGGFDFSTALRDAIAASGEAGMLFVASAGNNGRDTDLAPSYPASFDLPNIISVANTNNRDLRVPASNWGRTTVDLGAPGRQILSTVKGGGYGLMSGTSMAAPHVTGVASLAWGLQPGATYEQVRDAIFNGVDKIPAMQGATPTVTGGRLNAYNTLRLMLRGRSATVMEGVPAGEPSPDLTVSGVIGLATLTEQDRDVIH